MMTDLPTCKSTFVLLPSSNDYNMAIEHRRLDKYVYIYMFF